MSGVAWIKCKPLRRKPIEQNTLSRANLFHAKALFVCKCLSCNLIFAQAWVLFYLFMNYLG